MGLKKCVAGEVSLQTGKDDVKERTVTHMGSNTQTGLQCEPSRLTGRIAQMLLVDASQRPPNLQYSSVQNHIYYSQLFVVAFSSYAGTPLFH